MKIKIFDHSSILAMLPIRECIEKVNVRKKIDVLTQNLLYPWDKSEELKKTSLTDRPDYEDQIRFFLKERTFRKIHNVVDIIFKKAPDLEIEVVNYNFNNEIFNKFLHMLVAKCPIRFVPAEPKQTHPHPYTNEEIQLLELTQFNSKLTQEQMTNASQLLKKYVSTGDAWTVENICDRLSQRNNMDEILFDWANCKGILDKTFDSQFLLEKYRELNPLKNTTSANYPISMLYLRHHPVIGQNHEKAKALLDEGLSMTDANSKDARTEFNRIFNRNGFALAVFREKKVDEAIAFLKTGISKLDSTHNMYHMHKTVLIYNLAKCYIALGDFNQAIIWYKNLIALDEKYPEYHMELARCYIQTEQYELALAELESAENLDRYIAEIYSLKGYIFQRMESYENSLKNYQRAFDLQPENQEFLYDLCLSLGMNEKYEELLRVSSNYKSFHWQEETYINLKYLQAEAYFHKGEVKQSISILERLSQRFPNDAIIRDNLSRVLAAA